MKKTKVWAHRGASGWDKQYAPENTMEAFGKAVQMGADGIELDVQLTKDGEVVIAHDEKIDRVSDRKGWLKDYTLAELKKISFSKTHPEYGFVQIPTLVEFLDFMKGNDLTINIELKTGLLYYDGLESKTLDIVKKTGMQERVWYSSFNHYSLRKIKEIALDSKIGLLCDQNFIDFPQYMDRLQAQAIHPAVSILSNEEFVENCRAEGIPLHVWTVDVKTEMKRMCELGIDAFITDCPDHGRRIVDGHL